MNATWMCSKYPIGMWNCANKQPGKASGMHSRDIFVDFYFCATFPGTSFGEGRGNASKFYKTISHVCQWIWWNNSIIYLTFGDVILIVNSRFLQLPQKRSCGNKLIHRCLTKKSWRSRSTVRQAGRQAGRQLAMELLVSTQLVTFRPRSTSVAVPVSNDEGFACCCRTT